MEKDLENELNKVVEASTAKKEKIIGAPKKEKIIGAKDIPLDASAVELTEAEKTALRKEAAIEVAAELKKEKIKAFKAAEKQLLKKQVLFQAGKDDAGEDLEAVLVTLASHTPFLSLDGKRYYPGRVYRLNRNTAQVIKEQMYRGELHQNEIDGKNMKEFYGARKVGLQISPNMPLPAGVA